MLHLPYTGCIDRKVALSVIFGEEHCTISKLKYYQFNVNTLVTTVAFSILVYTNCITEHVKTLNKFGS